jgi:hypothetical protein
MHGARQSFVVNCIFHIDYFFISVPAKLNKNNRRLMFCSHSLSLKKFQFSINERMNDEIRFHYDNFVPLEIRNDEIKI